MSGLANPKPLDPYELGKLLRARQDALPDPAQRAQDLLYRLATQLSEVTMALDLRDRALAQLQAQESRRATGSWRSHNTIVSLQRQVAALQAQVGRKRAKKRRVKP